MKFFIQFIFTLVLFTSCSQVFFTSPQPQKGFIVKSFINEIQGVYSDSTLKVEVRKNDLIISGDHYKLSSKIPVENEVLIRFYKDFYFASFKDSAYYSVFMAKFYENKLAVYMLNADQLSISRLQKLNKVEVIDSINDTYLINITNKIFDQLIDAEMFSVVNVLVKK